MGSRHFWSVARTGVLVLASSMVAMAQGPTRVRFEGLINDYSPEAISPTGPWEIRGVWELALAGSSGKADFSAELTMVRSDYWVLTNNADPDDPSARMPHTHHITLVDGTVTALANGFRVSGPVSVTGNGNPAPFGATSTLQIDLIGGSLVAPSNVRLTFDGDATAHFGTQSLDGVVLGR